MNAIDREPWEPGAPYIDADGEIHNFQGRWFDREGRPLTNMNTIERLLGDRAYKIIAQERLWHGAVVSTIWLGLNHCFLAEGPPLIFESMVFAPGTAHDLDCRRYATEAAARAGHAELRQAWRGRPWPGWRETGRRLGTDTAFALAEGWRWLRARRHRDLQAALIELELESSWEKLRRLGTPIRWATNLWARLLRRLFL